MKNPHKGSHFFQCIRLMNISYLLHCISVLLVSIQGIINLNSGESYENMIAHCSYTRNLSSCEIKA